MATVLRVKNLCKRYVRGAVWGRCVRVAAVNDVAFEIASEKTLALIGRSGSGKSTIARCITRIEKPDSGEVWIDGTEISQLSSRDLFPFRAQVQMVFQDASLSMNPRFTALQVLEEPLLVRRVHSTDRRTIAAAHMADVGLPADSMNRPITDFSGGQRQRLAIARALVLRPKVLVLDEALTGLDLSTQAQIANLLLDLQETYSLTYLFISHDLALAAHLGDSVAVISGGQIVEAGTSKQVLSQPQHEETIKLVASCKAKEEALQAMMGTAE